MRTLLLLLIFGTSSVFGDVRLPGYFGDHMVLQQQKPIRIWGWANAGEKVNVTLGDAIATVNADRSGHWEVNLPAREASTQPMTLTVTGGNTVELEDILIGEVWLCSGQSNMEWTVSRSLNAAEEIAAANDGLIRHIKIPRKPNFVPQEDIAAPWQICSPETAGNFTACGYFMARKLREELGVPIGLINSSWGGTRVEPWTPPIGFQGVEKLEGIADSIAQRTPGTDAYQGSMKTYLEQVRGWIETAEQNFSNQQPIVPSPAFPNALKPFQSHQDPTMLYNGMIHALVGHPIRGAIWYQGESNHTEGMLYTAKKQALIEGWRELWGQGDFDFHFVQIAPFQYGNEAGNILAEFWEAQEAVLEVPNTGMVVINDIATLNDIHPPNKQDVGLRLANLALKNSYGRKDVVAESPRLEKVVVAGAALKVVFQEANNTLKTRDGKAPDSFEIIGPGSSGFHPATAVIEGSTVTLTSPKVPQPTAFRFAWDKLAEPNLTGSTGLPVGAVRGGEMPEFTSQLPLDDYRLVYDLDLSKLSADISYAVKDTASVNEFDRVGYLVELDSPQLGSQKVWASMDAFTKDVNQIAIPTVSSKASFQQNITNLQVMAEGVDLGPGSLRQTGNIEFWPNNYAPNNTGRVRNASGSAFDFGDMKADPADGYGCMQVHDYGARQTIFSINHWKTGQGADLGIGNSNDVHPDWTFSSNANQYTAARLRVYVREVH